MAGTSTSDPKLEKPGEPLDLEDWSKPTRFGRRERLTELKSRGRRRKNEAVAVVTRCHPELEKWSGRSFDLAQDRPVEVILGRLDSNQRPPAPKSAVSQAPATLCETEMAFKFLIQNDLTQLIA